MHISSVFHTFKYGALLTLIGLSASASATPNDQAAATAAQGLSGLNESKLSQSVKTTLASDATTSGSVSSATAAAAASVSASAVLNADASAVANSSASAVLNADAGAAANYSARSDDADVVDTKATSSEHMASIPRTSISKDDSANDSTLIAPSMQSEAVANLHAAPSTYSSSSAYADANRAAAVAYTASKLKAARAAQVGAGLGASSAGAGSAGAAAAPKAMKSLAQDGRPTALMQALNAGHAAKSGADLLAQERGALTSGGSARAEAARAAAAALNAASSGAAMQHATMAAAAQHAALSSAAQQAAVINVGSRMGTPASVSAQDLAAHESFKMETLSEDGRVRTTVIAPPGGIQTSKIPGTNINKILMSTVKVSTKDVTGGDGASGSAAAASVGDIAFMGIEIYEAPESDNVSLKRELDQRIKPLVGRKLSAELLEDVGRIVKEFYRSKGYLNCETYMPQQNINLDHATFKIGVKGTELYKTNIENQSLVRDSYLKYLLTGITDFEGKDINYTKIFGQMLKLNDLGTMQVQGQFDSVTPDNIVNNLDLMVAPGTDRAYFTSSVDNFGSESSGRYRFGGNLDIASPTGSADRLNLFYSHTDEDQADYSMGYTIPVNSSPTLLGASLCYSHAELGGIYRELGTKNEELTFEAFARHPIYRDDVSLANVQAGYIYRKMSTDFSVFDLKTKKHSNAVYLQFSGSKNFIGNAIVASTLRLTAGRIENDDDYEMGIEGNFLKLNGNIGYSYILSPHFTTVTNVDFQISNTLLDGSEVMQTGGENGLLAYQSADMCGDSGIMVKQSLQYIPDASLGFVISPHVEVSKVFTHDYDSQRAASAGLSLMYNRYGLSAMCDVSHVIGSLLDYIEDSSRINFKLSYTF